jgi:hypothetical protein
MKVKTSPPAKAGVHVQEELDSRFRGNDVTFDGPRNLALRRADTGSKVRARFLASLSRKSLPSPPWGRGWPAAGAFTSRSGPGEGIRIIFIRLGGPQAHDHSE